MSKILLWCYEVSLVLVGAMLVLGQVLTPVLARELADGQPEAQPYVALYSTLAIAALLCCEVILAAHGRLAVLAAGGRLASRSTVRTVGVIAVAAAVMAVLAVTVLLHLIMVSRIGGPLPVLLSFGAALAGASMLAAALCGRNAVRRRMPAAQMG